MFKTQTGRRPEGWGWGWAVIENGDSAVGAGLFRTRDEGGEERVSVSSAASAEKKEAVADHSSVRGQIKGRQGWRRGHRFILSFSIYPFSPRKITSHFVVGERRLKVS